MQTARLAWFALALAATCGCKPKRATRAALDAGAVDAALADDYPLPRARIGKLSVRDVTPEPLRVFTVDAAALEAAARKAIDGSAAFAAAGEGEPYDLRIDVASVTVKPGTGSGTGTGTGDAVEVGKRLKGPAVVQILIEATLTPRSGDPEAAERVTRGVAEREVKLEAHVEAAPRVQADAERALAGTLDDLIAEERLRSGDPAEIAAALGAPDPELRAMAIRYAGARRSRTLVGRLAGFLRDPDSAIRDAAIGALVDIGDPAAVKPLTDAVEFKDTGSMRRILDAIAALGGDEADSYLDLVASGHEDERIRALAQSALDRLRRKAPKPK